MVDWAALARELLRESRFLLAAAVLVVGLLVGYFVGRVSRRVLVAAGVPAAVEGTAFERTARGLGSSTVGVFSQLSALFVYAVVIILSLEVARLLDAQMFVVHLTAFLPQLFIATLALIAGLVIGDKVELVISERLRGVKLPEIGVIPKLAKYSVIYIAVLIALGQVGVATGALLVLLVVYVFGVVFLGGLAFRDLLAASAAGIYLLLNQPYSIGDEVSIDGRRGIVQDMNVFVTHIENDSEEFIVPNHHVFRAGVVRIRDS